MKELCFLKYLWIKSPTGQKILLKPFQQVTRIYDDTISVYLKKFLELLTQCLILFGCLQLQTILCHVMYPAVNTEIVNIIGKGYSYLIVYQRNVSRINVTLTRSGVK